jgi:hypothetical protein
MGSDFTCDNYTHVPGSSGPDFRTWGAPSNSVALQNLCHLDLLEQFGMLVEDLEQFH